MYRATMVLLILFSLTAYGQKESSVTDSLLTEARQLFYESVESKSKIQKAEAIFQKIYTNHDSLKGRAQTYLGALVMLKGKHSFWPHDKLKWVKRGLKLMDAGLDSAGNDIEALFVHGTTCHYLPFFFRRGDDAKRSLQALIKLLPDQGHLYDKILMKNVVNFIREHVDLSEEEKTILLQLKSRYEWAEATNEH